MLRSSRGGILEPWKILVRIWSPIAATRGAVIRRIRHHPWCPAPTAKYYTSYQNVCNRTAERRTLSTSISTKIEGDVNPEETTGTTLRPYQESAVTACLSALSSGLTRIGVSSPTGSGKTTMFMSLIPRIETVDQRSRVLILVGSVELAIQAENAAKRILGDGWRVEVEQGKRQASGTADITIGTYQTLNNVERLRKFDPSRTKLVIVDEAHHAAAFSYMRLLHYFNDGVELPSAISPIGDHNHGSRVPIIGFSATFSRPDQLALSAVFQKIVFHREVTHMLDEGWLSPARSTTVQCDMHLDDVETNVVGDYKTSSLAHHVNTATINDLIVRTYLHRAGDRRSTLIFCVDLSHVANVTQAFRDAGIDARSISSISAPTARKETLNAFARGDYPVLVNCEVLTEGTDIPVIDCVILARPTKSRNLLAQMVGRGLRLSPETGKVDCHIIDIVDSIDRAGGMLVSPTLFGLTHDELAEEMREKAEREDGAASDLAMCNCQLDTADWPKHSCLANAEDVLNDIGVSPPSDSTGLTRVKSVTFLDEDDPFKVASPTRQPLARLSSNAWVAVGGDRYILEMLGNGYISVDPRNDGEAKWSIKYRQKLPMSLGSTRWYSRVRDVGSAEELERAIQTSDKYAERTMGRDLYSKLSRYAEWRQRPASPKAIAMLLKIRGIKGDQKDVKEIDIMGRIFPLARLTAGQVGSYLCAANHGAMGLRKKEDKLEATRLKRLQAKEDKQAAARARNLPLPSTV